MAAGDARQVGVTYLIGIGNSYYEAYTPMTGTTNTTDEITDHKDARGAIDSHLIQNPGKTLSLTLDIVSEDDTDFLPPAKGSVVSMKGPSETEASNWFVRDASVSMSMGVAQLSMTVEKTDSMAATYGAIEALAAVTNIAFSAVGSDGFLMTYTPAASATGYKYYISAINSIPSTPVAETNNGSANGYYFSGLDASTTYYVWVETLGGLAPNPTATDSQATSA